MERVSALGVTAWRWIAIAAVLVAAAAICFAVINGDDSAETRPASAPVEPCANMNPNQQATGAGQADSPAVARTDFGAESRLSLAAHGVCLDTGYELHTRGWKVTRADMAVQQGERRWSASVGPEDPTPLYVPITGCVDASWVYHLQGPDGVTGTWTVEHVNGVRCSRYRG